MFCINCFHKSTRVTNSRAHKTQPFVWRRRQCENCEQAFTTHEKPSLADNKLVVSPKEQLNDEKKTSKPKAEPFNLGKLIISLAEAFAHSPKDAQYSTLWLAQTVQDTLSTQQENVTPEDIAVTAHTVLKRFDEVAALQYAARHQLITSTRRRGRPSLTLRAPLNE